MEILWIPVGFWVSWFVVKRTVTFLIWQVVRYAAMSRWEVFGAADQIKILYADHGYAIEREYDQMFGPSDRPDTGPNADLHRSLTMDMHSDNINGMRKRVPAFHEMGEGRRRMEYEKELDQSWKIMRACGEYNYLWVWFSLTHAIENREALSDLAMPDEIKKKKVS